MNNIESVAETVEKILEKNGVKYVLVCPTEDDCTIVGMDCTPNEALVSIGHIIVNLKEAAAENGISKLEVGNNILSVVAQALLDDEEAYKTEELS